MAQVVLPSACPLDCPDSCSLDVTVDDGRVSALEGNHLNSTTGGFICGKVRNIADHLYGPDRLHNPGILSGSKGNGRFRWTDWDEALSFVADRLVAIRDEFGGESILPLYYGGSNGSLTQDAIDTRFFRRLGASRLLRTVCAEPTSRAATGLYGKMPGVALQDYVHARLIVVWGANPHASNIHLVPFIQEAREKGARLVVVDPRRTPLARQADLHLPVRPGTDLPVALGVIRWLFEHDRADSAFLAEQTRGAGALRSQAAPWTVERAAEVAGIEPALIETLAIWYADAEPAVVRCGWGLERNRNGGSAVSAVLALPAVAGKFGVRGGGYTLSNSGAFRLGADAAIAEPEPETRAISMNHLGQALTDYNDPPVQALFVYNANPLATLPNQELVRSGLARKDLFTVVFDQVLTDSAQYADVVLPATTFLEHTELRRGYGAMVIQDSEPVIEPVGNSRPNYAVFSELCERAGLDKPDDPNTPAELRATILAASEGGDGFRAGLDQDRIAPAVTGETPVQFGDVFPNTPDGKVHLMFDGGEEELPYGLYAYQDDPATRRYPLALISPATSRTVSSTFGQLHRKPAAVELHPDDAAARSLSDGDTVRVFNDLGEVHCLLQVSDDQRPGVACLAKGLWSHNTFNGNTSNALSPDTEADLGRGACFNDARVQIERLSAG